MRDPLSSTIKTIQPSGIRKFFDIVSEMKDAISLGVGEPDFDTPWHIRDEGIYSLEKGRTFYTSNAGLKELKVEIAKYLDRRYGMTYDYNKEIMVTVGGSSVIPMLSWQVFSTSGWMNWLMVRLLQVSTLPSGRWFASAILIRRVW